MDAASVSSTVSWCRPELSSPSSISSITVTTITHLHLHYQIWRVSVGVERGREVEEYEGIVERVITGAPYLNTISVGFCMNGCGDFTVSQADIKYEISTGTDSQS